MKGEAANGRKMTASGDPRSNHWSRQAHVIVHVVTEPASEADLRRREYELERLIIKAACRRAARLAVELRSGDEQLPVLGEPNR